MVSPGLQAKDVKILRNEFIDGPVFGYKVLFLLALLPLLLPLLRQFLPVDPHTILNPLLAS